MENALTDISKQDLGDPDYWHTLIDEADAAKFMDVTTRTMQKWRYQGGGPKYIVLSARCIRYTRAKLKHYSDARIRSSTADAGEAA